MDSNSFVYPPKFDSNCLCYHRWTAWTGRIVRGSILTDASLRNWRVLDFMTFLVVIPRLSFFVNRVVCRPWRDYSFGYPRFTGLYRRQ